MAQPVNCITAERPFRAAGLDYLKHYTVKDAAYTPDGLVRILPPSLCPIMKEKLNINLNREHFVTCGEDRRLSLWRSMSDSHMPEWYVVLSLTNQ